MNSSGAAEWLALFIEYMLKTTLVLSICLLLVLVSVKRTAAIRHFLLSFFLIGLLLLPVVSTFEFGWETDLLPARTSVAINKGIREPAGPSESNFPGTQWLSTTSHASRAAGASGPDSIGPAATAFPPGTDLIGIPGGLLPFVWSAGLTFIVLKLSLGMLGAYRLTREGSDVADPVWRTLLARFIAAIRIRRTVRLKSHGAVGVPVTWGLLSPVILIPRCHDEWTEDQRSSALLHELCHIKRADLLVMFLVRLSLALFWFNPLCWIVFRWLKQEQERACDELVLTTGVKPSTYAATLLFFKRTAGFRQNVPAAFLGFFDAASFHQRLAAILRQKLTLKEVTMKTKITLAIAVMLAVSLIGMTRPPKAISESPLNSNAHTVKAPQPVMPQARVAANMPGTVDQDTRVDVRKEPDKKKEQQKGTIVIMNQEGEKTPIEITIVTDGTARKLRVEKPLTIKEGKEGELILLGPEGKEIEILKGEPIRLTIEGKDLTVVKKGDSLKIDRAGVLSLISGRDLEDAVDVLVVPRGKIKKSGEIGAKKIGIYIPKKGEDGRFIVAVTGQDQTVRTEEKIKKLREKLAQRKDKQIDVAEGKQAIKRLEADLVKQKVGKRLKIKVGEKPMTFTLMKPQGITVAENGIWIVKDPIKKSMTIITGSGPNISIMFGINPGENSREVYERIVASVKQELPEGYAIEPEFNEKSGAITLKISGPGMAKAPKYLIKKVVDVIKTEIK